MLLWMFHTNSHINRLLFAILSLAVSWWGLAWFFLTTETTEELIVMRILALMGLCYLAWGIWVASKDSRHFLFLIYCCLAAMHWGGPIDAANETTNFLLLGIFIVVASTSFDALLLHMGLSFPTGKLKKWLLYLIYLPVVLGMLMLLAVFSLGLDRNYMTIVYSMGMIEGILAGSVWLFRIVTLRIVGINRRQSIVIASALLLAWLPGLFSSTGLFGLDAYSDVSNLTLIIVPAVLAWLYRHS